MAVYDHSSGVGAWGPILVELTQVHGAEPAGLGAALTAPAAGVGHVAWLADDLEAETERLIASAACVRSTPAGPAPCRRCGSTAAASFGHPVEVLKRGPEVLGFYEHVRAAARDWDGAEPFQQRARAAMTSRRCNTRPPSTRLTSAP